MPRLRVLIDGRMLIGRFSGVARMVTRLVENLADMPELRIVVLCGNQPYEPWIERTDLRMIVSDFSRADRSPVRRFFWEATRLRHWIGESRADVFHATWNTGVPFRCPVPAVLTIHDAIPWDKPPRQLSTIAERAVYRYSLRASARRAKRVTAVSEFTAAQVGQRIGPGAKQIRVVHNGVDQPATSAAVASSGRPYILYVGGHEPRKNLESLFGAVAHYWRHFDPEMDLHLTGSAAQLSPAAKSAYDRISQKSRVVFLGSPNDEELAREYAGATALLMLSRAEGFGLPVIEAMAHGCPVIAARCGSLPEVVGEAGVLVDPDDIQWIAASIHEVTSSRARAGTVIEKGRQRAANFSWTRVAQAYLAEYQLAASRTATESPLEPLSSAVAVPDFR